MPRDRQTGWGSTIGNQTVGADELMASAVDDVTIEGGAGVPLSVKEDGIGTRELAPNAVTAENMAAGAVGTPLFATGSTTSTTAGTSVASLAAPAGHYFAFAHFVAAEGTGPQFYCVYTYTDDTTETGTTESGHVQGGLAGYMGDVSPGFVRVTDKRVKKMEVFLGASVGSGTKKATLTALAVKA